MFIFHIIFCKINQIRSSINIYVRLIKGRYLFAVLHCMVSVAFLFSVVSPPLICLLVLCPSRNGCELALSCCSTNLFWTATDSESTRTVPFRQAPRSVSPFFSLNRTYTSDVFLSAFLDLIDTSSSILSHGTN